MIILDKSIIARMAHWLNITDRHPNRIQELTVLKALKYTSSYNRERDPVNKKAYLMIVVFTY